MDKSIKRINFRILDGLRLCKDDVKNYSGLSFLTGRTLTIASLSIISISHLTSSPLSTSQSWSKAKGTVVRKVSPVGFAFVSFVLNSIFISPFLLIYSYIFMPLVISKVLFKVTLEVIILVTTKYINPGQYSTSVKLGGNLMLNSNVKNRGSKKMCANASVWRMVVKNLFLLKNSYIKLIYYKTHNLIRNIVIIYFIFYFNNIIKQLFFERIYYKKLTSICTLKHEIDINFLHLEAL